MRSVSRAGAPAHLAFLVLVVVNLVSGFHALGTLLAVGMMMLPAAIGRFWARDGHVDDRDQRRASGVVSGYAGLLLSFHTRRGVGSANHPGCRRAYVLSLLFGRVGGLGGRPFPAATSRRDSDFVAKDSAPC